jgi:hypothetical protein
MPMGITGELTKKVEDAILDNKLVGDMLFVDNEYEELLKYTRDFSLRYSRGSASLDGNHKMHFVALVEIAKRWKRIDDDENDERGFWEHVFKTLLGVGGCDNKLYKAYTKLICDLGREENILIANTAKKYWATLMMHAFAPIRSVYAFFDLCYNIYRKDLDFNYTESDKWICEIARKRFCEILQSSVGNDKTISIGSNTYNVQIGLRILALDASTQNEFVVLLDRTLKIIDTLFHRTTLAPKSYFEDIINDWWKNKLAEVRRDRKTGNRTSAAVTKRNITSKFIRNDNNVNLVIPPIRLDGKGSTVWLSVYAGENGERRYSDELFTRYGELTVTTKQKDFDLNELLKQDRSIRIRVEITENGTVLYDKVIEREFILFDGENEVLSQLNKSSNYFVYARDIYSLKMPTDIQTCGGNLYNIYPKAGETLAGETRQVFFVDKLTPTKNEVRLFGSLPDCEWRVDDIGYRIFGGQVMLIVPDDTALNGLSLSVDAKRVLLSELTRRQEDEYQLFDISGFVPKCKPTEVEVFSHQKERRFIGEHIAVFPNLNIGFSKPAYYGKDERKLTITVEDESKDLSWENSDNEVVYPFNEGQLVVKIPYIRWRIDDKEWNNEPLNKRRWYKAHFHSGSLLEIDSPQDLEGAMVFAFADGVTTEVERNKISGKFEVGRFIYAAENKREIMFSLQNAGKTHELFVVSTAEHFAENPLTYAGGKLLWQAEDTFIGDETRKFNVLFARTGYTIPPVEGLGCADTQITGLGDGLYNVQISSQAGNLFKKENKVFFEGKLIVGRKEKFRFAGKYIKLIFASTELTDDDVAQMYWKPFMSFYGVDNLQFVEMEGGEFYIGLLFSKDIYGRKIYLDKMKDDSNNYEWINPVRILLATKNTLEIIAGHKPNDIKDFLGGLMYDTKRKSICNINARGAKGNIYPCINYYKFTEVNDDV